MHASNKLAEASWGEHRMCTRWLVQSHTVLHVEARPEGAAHLSIAAFAPMGNRVRSVDEASDAAGERRVFRCDDTTEHNGLDARLQI
eukprot:2387859-Pleurochrysis_carterae.AAC.5